MATLGATEREIAAALGIAVSTLNRWTHDHPKFRDSLKPGKKPADDRVERSLYQRATGYSFDSEKLVPYDHVETLVKGNDEKVLVREKRVMRVPIVEHVPPDTTAAIFWLKNRRKDDWRDFKATELSTPPGRPLEFANTGEAELIGQYYARVGRAGSGPNAPAGSGPDGADPRPDPGVGEGGQGPQGQGRGPKAHKGR